MRYVTIGRYQFSVILLLIAAVASPLAFAATYYIWSSKTVSFSVDEPLSVLDFPASVHFHPGQNSTLDITIANSANINYAVSLIITLSDSDSSNCTSKSATTRTP
jgi:glutathione peroxidase-family protein